MFGWYIGILIVPLVWALRSAATESEPEFYFVSTCSTLFWGEEPVKLVPMSQFAVMLLSVLNLSARSINMFGERRRRRDIIRNWLRTQKGAKRQMREAP